MAPRPIAIAVFVGTRGRGSNMAAVHEASMSGALDGRISVVIGSNDAAPALARARAAGLPVAVVDPKSYAEADDYGRALLTVLRQLDADTIALAGYLRRLPASIVEAFHHRIVNVHPSLLPAFGGKGMYGEHVHRAVLEYGCKVSGCTVHLVDEAYDTGPIIFQRTVPIKPGDTPASLAARILPHEHRAFVEALQAIASGRLAVDGRVVTVSPVPAL